jgi:hypothetical protein
MIQLDHAAACSGFGVNVADNLKLGLHALKYALYALKLCL